MGTQLHKRHQKEFVMEILEAFNDRRITEEKACELLGIKRARLYIIRKIWLKSIMANESFELYNRKESSFHRMPEDVENWLHRQLSYIDREADKYRRRFNFAVLTEEAQKEFKVPFNRETFRLFALRHGYYHASPEEKKKFYMRFETSGPGCLFQHDSSRHCWVPALGGYQYLILSKDDYSRLFVGVKLIQQESSFEHLDTVRMTVQRYGRALAYYVDQHSIFRFVERHPVHLRYSPGMDEGEIQFRRALESLDIGIIYASKGEAEAKGKVEKAFDYLQRRIPYLCEKYKIKSIPDASNVVDEVVSFYNEQREHAETGQIPIKRWQEAINAGKGKLRPLDPSMDLDVIFSLHSPRTVKKDGTFSFAGKDYKLGSFASGIVTVCLIPGKKITVVKDNQKVGEFCL